MPVTTGPPPAAAVEANSVMSVLDGVAVLSGVDLHLLAGTSLAVVGPSGSGKTTLLMTLAGVTVPTAGRVRLAGHDLAHLSDRQRAALRLRHVGIVYQFGELLPELTAMENVALPALLAGTGRREAYDRAGRLLRELGVAVADHAPASTLSGGERQRTATARALINQPPLVLADEPTGALDQDSTEVVADLLFALPRSLDCALVVATHNDRVAARADRVVELRSGTLHEITP